MHPNFNPNGDLSRHAARVATASIEAVAYGRPSDSMSIEAVAYGRPSDSTPTQQIGVIDEMRDINAIIDRCFEESSSITDRIAPILVRDPKPSIAADPAKAFHNCQLAAELGSIRSRVQLLLDKLHELNQDIRL